MADLILTRIRIHDGLYEATITANRDRDTPHLSMLRAEDEVSTVEVTQDEASNTWHIRCAIPQHVISEGVETLTLVEAGKSAPLDSFAIVIGQDIANDLRAEVDLLRAELDLLKRAFRRHCNETQ